MDSKLLFPLATAFLVLCLVETGESSVFIELSWQILAPSAKKLWPKSLNQVWLCAEDCVYTV